jgi:uncharacterized membrane protein
MFSGFRSAPDQCQWSDITEGRQLGENRSERVNIGAIERAVCTATGTALSATGVWFLVRRSTPLGILMTAVGGVLTYRGVMGRSRVYRALGISGRDAGRFSHPLSREIKVERSITINRGPDEIYQFWREFTNLPRIMQHLESVEVLDERRSRWTAKGPADQPVTWDAEITEDRPNECIAWQSVESTALENRGQVEFKPAPGGRGCVVRVQLIYKPLGGVLGAAVAKMFGRAPGQTIDDDLRRFKQEIEAGELATNAGPTGLGWQSGPDAGARQGEAVGATAGATGSSPGSGMAHADAGRRIDTAGKESFPASDAPGWTRSPGGTHGGE